MESKERIIDILATARMDKRAMKPLDELVTTLAGGIFTALRDTHGPSFSRQRNIAVGDIESAVYAAIADWKVERKDTPHRDGHPEQGYGHYVKATLPWVAETDTERTEREAREVARSWAWKASLTSWDREDPGYYGDEVGPPPARVGIYHLLQQGLWWRMRAPDAADPDDGGRVPTVAIRLEDMTHFHRLSLLGFLRQRAEQFKLREDWHYASMPGPNGEMAQDAFETECDRQWNTPAAEWIENQPLARALVHWTTPYAESPLTWRPTSEVTGRPGFTAVVRCTDGTELVAFWNPEEWVWERGEDSMPLDALNLEPVEWRALRDEERPLPPEPACEHPSFEETDCEICGSIFYPCRHGGVRDSDYCHACEQE